MARFFSNEGSFNNLEVSGSTVMSASVGVTTRIIGTGSTVLSVSGSTGEILRVADTNSPSIFSVSSGSNTILDVSSVAPYFFSVSSGSNTILAVESTRQVLMNVSGSKTTGVKMLGIPQQTASFLLTYISESGVVGYSSGSNFTATLAINALTSSYPIAVTGSGAAWTLYTTYNQTVNRAFNTSNINGNIFLGPSAGNGAINLSNSNFLGTGAGLSATQASDSNFFGESVGFQATNAQASNFFGNSVGLQATNASNSNFFGYRSGYGATNASNSNFFGRIAGYAAISASFSTLIGYKAGYITGSFPGIGTNNIIIGTAITLPVSRRDSINIGGIIFGTGSYSEPYNGVLNSSLLTSSFSGSAGGRIGINVVNPNYNFEVSGTVAFPNLTTGSATNVVMWGANGQLFVTASSALGGGTGTVGPGEQNYLAFFSGSTTTISSSNVYYDRANQRVGIGTTNPTQKLEVSGSIKITSPFEPSDGAKLIMGSETTASFRIMTYGISPDIYTVLGSNTTETGRFNTSWQGGGVYFDTRDAVPPIRFMVQSSGSALPITAMSITPTGNVGIGTTNPAYKLDVPDNSVRINKILFDTGNPYTRRIFADDTLQYQTNATNVPQHFFGNFIGTAFGGANASIVTIQAYESGDTNTGSAGTAILRLKGDRNLETTTFLSNGRVGIGTTSPSYSLHASGTIGFPSLTAQAQPQIITYNTASGQLFYTDIPVGTLTGGTANYIPLWTATNALSSSIIYQTNRNISINTTESGHNLRVSGSTLLHGITRVSESAFFEYQSPPWPAGSLFAFAVPRGYFRVGPSNQGRPNATDMTVGGFTFQTYDDDTYGPASFHFGPNPGNSAMTITGKTNSKLAIDGAPEMFWGKAGTGPNNESRMRIGVTTGSEYSQGYDWPISQSNFFFLQTQMLSPGDVNTPTPPLDNVNVWETGSYSRRPFYIGAGGFRVYTNRSHQPYGGTDITELQQTTHPPAFTVTTASGQFTNDARVGVNVLIPSFSFHVSGTVGFPNLTNNIQSWIVGYDNTTGQLYYQGAQAASLTGGTTNYIPLWRSSTELSSSILYQSQSRVGINLSPIGTPAATLQVNGNILVGQSGSFMGGSINFIRPTDGALMSGISVPDYVTLRIGGGNQNIIDIWGHSTFINQFSVNGPANTSPSYSQTLRGPLFLSSSEFQPNHSASYILFLTGSGVSGSANINNTLYVSGSRVGIGYTNPTHRLHVSGSALIGLGQSRIYAGDKDTVIIGDSSVPTSTTRVAITAGDGAASEIWLYYSSSYAGEIKSAASGRIHINPASESLFLIGGQEKARFASNGNFGIGITNPIARLDVSASSNGSISISGLGNGDSWTNLISITGSGGQVFNFNAGGSETKLSLKQNGTGNTSTWDFITANGTNLNGGSNINSIISKEYADLVLSQYSALHIKQTGPAGDNKILLKVVDVNSDTKLIISSSNVGIGLSTPDYKLQVTGSGILGSFNSNNTLYVSSSNVGIGTATPTGSLEVIGKTIIKNKSSEPAAILEFRNSADMPWIFKHVNNTFGVFAPRAVAPDTPIQIINLSDYVDASTPNLVFGGGAQATGFPHYWGINTTPTNNYSVSFAVREYSSNKYNIAGWTATGTQESFGVKPNGDGYFSGSVGIGILNPLYNLDVSGIARINDIMNLERRTTNPISPEEGMIIASGSAGSSKLYYYDGTIWNPLF